MKYIRINPVEDFNAITVYDTIENEKIIVPYSVQDN